MRLRMRKAPAAPGGEPTGWWWGPDTPCASGFPSPFSEPKLPGRLRMAEGPPGARALALDDGLGCADGSARGRGAGGAAPRVPNGAGSRGPPRSISISRERWYMRASTVEAGRPPAARPDGGCVGRPFPHAQTPANRDDDLIGTRRRLAERRRPARAACAPTTDPARSRRGNARRDDVRGWRARAPGCACGATPRSTTPASNEATVLAGDAVRSREKNRTPSHATLGACGGHAPRLRGVHFTSLFVHSKFLHKRELRGVNSSRAPLPRDATREFLDRFGAMV